MRTRSRLILAALAATALFGLAVQSASANSLSIDEQEFELIWTALELEAGGNTVRCPVTLLGSFERSTIAKRAGQVGVIHHAEIRGNRATGECTGGEATILSGTLPWPVNYVSFAGTLPTIASVTLNLIGASFQVNVAGIVECLARTEANQPGQGIASVSGGSISSIRANERIGITTTGGFFCTLAGAAHFKGTASVTNLAQTEPLHISLI